MLYPLLRKKKCKNCGKVNHRDVLFCWLCGSSFNLRICASGHKNPAWVRHCLTCGKDRSFMSRPHSTKELSFVQHPTKRSTYVPDPRKGAKVLGWLMVSLGAALLWYMAFLITKSL